MVSNLFSPEGCTGHDIKFPGLEHGGFARIMMLKNEIMLFLVEMSGPDVACRP